MNRLILISSCWLLRKTLVMTTNLTNPESASDNWFTWTEEKASFMLLHKFKHVELTSSSHVINQESYISEIWDKLTSFMI